MSLYFDNEKLFDAEGHLTDEGLYALKDGTLDDLGALEAAEHLILRLLPAAVHQNDRQRAGMPAAADA